MALIDIQDVQVAYGSPPRTILNNICLLIAEGDFVCLLGETGCGKSTLLRLVLGSEKPTGGRVLIDGTEHLQPDRSRGYVPQKYSLFPDRTVLDNITFGPEVSEFNLFTRLTPRYFRSRRELQSKARDYLRKIGLSEADASKYPDELSGGMQQRVAIAQALMMEPRILLMDEAFSALDPATRKEMQQLIRKLWRDSGVTVLFVTHNMQEALALASRVVVLAKSDESSGSRVVLDLAVPPQCSEQEIPLLMKRIECASSSRRASVDVPIAVG